MLGMRHGASSSDRPGSPADRSGRRILSGSLAPAIAAVLATAAVLIGWQGVDLPAALYRVGLFHRAGLTLWDSQWYGGHWTLDYSVLFPPVAGVLSIELTAECAHLIWPHL
jgi:hypothetical protein